MSIIRSIFLFIISFYVSSTFATDLFLCKAIDGTYKILWALPNDNSPECEKKIVSSETENVIFTSISPKQDKNYNIILSGSDKNNVFKPTTAIETQETMLNQNKNIDKQLVSIHRIQSKSQQTSSKSLVNLAMWNWEASTWLNYPEKFIKTVKSKGIDQIYLQLSIDNDKIADEEQLIELLDIAANNQIKIIAVEGSPDMVIESGLKYAIERNQVIKQFCQARKDKPCLAGIQYDIEPYILKEYNQDPKATWQLWNNAIKMLSQSWGDKIEVVIPFWLRNIDNGEQIVQDIAPYTSKYIVMVYRTDYDLIYNLSTDWLSWGDKNSKKITIALESGILDDELEKFYVPSKTYGEIEKVAFNDKDVILLNKEKLTSDNAIYTYSASSLEKSDAKNHIISFMGKEDNLFKTVNLLADVFPEWSSFDGIALHGLNF